MKDFLYLRDPRVRTGARKLLSLVVLVSFVSSLIVSPVNAQSLSTMVTVSQSPLLVGMKIHPENPLLFDFIVDQGVSTLSEDQLKLETEKLVKYFLAALTIPDNDVWVNLSPYEKDRVVPDLLGQTMMGKTMLEQDFLLKQLASSLTNPDEKLGSEYWGKVKAAGNQTAVEASTLSKVWIVPSTAEVLESNGMVLIGKKRLKVLMDAERSHQDDPAKSSGSLKEDEQSASSRVFRDIILPNIEKEVNEGKDFADVRQIYNSVILAAWYKQALKESLLGKVYADQGKVFGIETDDKTMKQRIYEQYVAAFKKGVYNIIKEEADSVTGEVVPRKYFSGGIKIAEFTASSALSITKVSPADLRRDLEARSSLKNAEIVLAENSEWQLTGSSSVEKQEGADDEKAGQARGFVSPGAEADDLQIIAPGDPLLDGEVNVDFGPTPSEPKTLSAAEQLEEKLLRMALERIWDIYILGQQDNLSPTSDRAVYYNATKEQSLLSEEELKVTRIVLSRMGFTRDSIREIQGSNPGFGADVQFYGYQMPDGHWANYQELAAELSKKGITLPGVASSSISIEQMDQKLADLIAKFKMEPVGETKTNRVSIGVWENKTTGYALSRVVLTEDVYRKIQSAFGILEGNYLNASPSGIAEILAHDRLLSFDLSSIEGEIRWSGPEVEEGTWLLDGLNIAEFKVRGGKIRGQAVTLITNLANSEKILVPGQVRGEVAIKEIFTKATTKQLRFNGKDVFVKYLGYVKAGDQWVELTRFIGLNDSQRVTRDGRADGRKLLGVVYHPGNKVETELKEWESIDTLKLAYLDLAFLEAARSEVVFQEKFTAFLNIYRALSMEDKAYISVKIDMLLAMARVGRISIPAFRVFFTEIERFAGFSEFFSYLFPDRVFSDDLPTNVFQLDKLARVSEEIIFQKRLSEFLESFQILPERSQKDIQGKVQWLQSLATSESFATNRYLDFLRDMARVDISSELFNLIFPENTFSPDPVVRSLQVRKLQELAASLKKQDAPAAVPGDNSSSAIVAKKDDVDFTVKASSAATLTSAEERIVETLAGLANKGGAALSDYVTSSSERQLEDMANIVITKLPDFEKYMSLMLWRAYKTTPRKAELWSANIVLMIIYRFKETKPSVNEVSLANLQEFASEIDEVLGWLDAEQRNPFIYTADNVTRRIAHLQNFARVVKGVLNPTSAASFEVSVKNAKGKDDKTTINDAFIKRMRESVAALKNEMNDLLEIKQVDSLDDRKAVAKMVQYLEESPRLPNRLKTTPALMAAEMVDIVQKKPALLSLIEQAVQLNLSSSKPIDTQTELYTTFVGRLSVLKPAEEQAAFARKFFPQSAGRITEDARVVEILRNLLKPAGSDQAPVAASSGVGGIDFNPTQMNLQIKRDGRGVPLPLPQQNLGNINIQGLHPVIINIVPVNPQTLPLILGQSDQTPAVLTQEQLSFKR
jgi:hypothetical protein